MKEGKYIGNYVNIGNLHLNVDKLVWGSNDTGANNVDPKKSKKNPRKQKY